MNFAQNAPRALEHELSGGFLVHASVAQRATGSPRLGGESEVAAVLEGEGGAALEDRIACGDPCRAPVCVCSRASAARPRLERTVMPPSSVHFNGSVNLPDAETVMREISTRIPVGVRRMTDGETGERGYWILFQIQKFQQMPEFEMVSLEQAYGTSPDAPPMAELRLAEGGSADTIDWPNLGYADEYAKSFVIFDRLQQDGTIPAGVRFQMQYPTPIASIAGTIVPEDLPTVLPSYEQALFADLDRLLAKLPHERCAVQWDVAVEFGLLEGAMGPGSEMPIDQVTPGLVRCWNGCPQRSQ